MTSGNGWKVNSDITGSFKHKDFTKKSFGLWILVNKLGKILLEGIIYHVFFSMQLHVYA